MRVALDPQHKHVMESPAVTLSLTPEFATVPGGGAPGAGFSLEVLATLRGREMGDAAGRAERAPIRMTAVVDRSGSMSGSKMALVKETLRFVVAQLTDKDAMGIVQYDHDVDELAPLTLASNEGKQLLMRCINMLHPRGSTFLCGGLVRGIKQIRAGVACGADPSPHEAVHTVLLMTDGLANVGVTTTSGILAEMDKLGRRSVSVQPTIFTFGFGTDHNDAMLSAIAEAGRGVYYFVESASKIPEAFADCLGGLVSVVARRLQLVVRAADRAQVALSATPMTTFPFQVREDGAVCVDINDLYGEESRDVLFGVRVLTHGGDGRVEVVQATLEFNEAGSLHRTRVAATCSVERMVQRPAEAPHAEVEAQRCRYVAAMAIRDAAAKANRGEVRAAIDVLATMKRRIHASGLGNHTMAQQIVQDMGDLQLEVADEEMFRQRGSKMATSLAQAWSHQRSVASPNARFQTTSKRNMVERFKCSSA